VGVLIGVAIIIVSQLRASFFPPSFPTHIGERQRKSGLRHRIRITTNAPHISIGKHPISPKKIRPSVSKERTGNEFIQAHLCKKKKRKKKKKKEPGAKRGRPTTPRR
jgi:hypothetical protein